MATTPDESYTFTLMQGVENPVDQATTTVDVSDTINTELLTINSINNGSSYYDRPASVNVTVTNTYSNTRNIDVAVQPGITTSFGSVDSFNSSTKTITFDDQPGVGYDKNYSLSSADRSADIVASVSLETATVDTIGHPTFDTMDRILAVMANPTFILLFLITGAAAMLASNTSGTIGAVLFTFLLLPGWLVLDFPLYLFAVALPATVILWKQSQTDSSTTEVHIDGMR